MFFETEVNSGRIFTEWQNGEVNILPLFTRLKRIIYFSIRIKIYLNIYRRNPYKVNLIIIIIDILKQEFILATPQGVNNAQLLRESKPIRLLETPKSLSESMLITIIIIIFIILLFTQ